MKRPTPIVCLTALGLAGLLAGGAATVAQTGRRTTPTPRVPENRLRVQPDPLDRSVDSREARTLIEDLENSSQEEIRSGRIGRYFTDPAVIITNGRMHRIEWSRLRSGRVDEPLDDPDRREPEDRNERLEPPDANVQIEGLQLRRIDPRTVVALYTAVIPDREGAVRQPVVATLVRERTGRGWRIASYTAENAAIPGGVNPDADGRGRLSLR